MLTPYAILSVAPRCTDEDVRARYYDRIRSQHPDMRKDHAPGPEWETLTTAYKAVSTQAARDRWYTGRRLLSGLCKVCKGYGVNFRAGPCTACAGRGRVV